ncbi:hypothetical protein CHARACLAT_002570 [Characodon lateralis]|uniref:Uncharacterized protein n=1 Tax=Characodon lateralis TaxID=208331 RepID=A0ABU7EFS7_9TELE|nr:hypothetical protein [Characodon lateralis]
MRLSTGPATQPDLRTCFSNSCCTGFREERRKSGSAEVRQSEKLPGVGLPSCGRFFQRGCIDLLASTGSQSPRIQKHGALYVN